MIFLPSNEAREAFEVTQRIPSVNFGPGSHIEGFESTAVNAYEYLYIVLHVALEEVTNLVELKFNTCAAGEVDFG